MIKVKDLWKSFGENQVLTGIDLHIPRGETLVVMGPSGCGKSVLLRLLTGLMKPDRGQIWFDGLEISTFSKKKLVPIRRRLGMLFQSAALFDFMTVEENVGFTLTQHQGMQNVHSIAKEKLKLVDLHNVEQLKPAEISGGMRKRVGLARAIADDPEVIFYDEPTTGLDPVTGDEINQLMFNLHEKLNVTSVIVTHDMDSAFFVATRMVMLHRGRVIAEGTPEEIKAEENPIVRQFIYSGSRKILDPHLKDTGEIIERVES